ncbi:MAG: RNA polymerase sigma factor [Planctomycetota bacterium]
MPASAANSSAAPAPAQEPAGEPAGLDWRAAMAEHSGWLRLVVLARLGEAGRGRTDAAAEVMQEVALAAARGASQLRDPAKAAPWLYRLAVTAALQHRRKAGRRRKLLERYRQRQAGPVAHGDAAAPCDSAAPCDPAVNAAPADPLEWLIAQEQRSLVRAALAELPPRDAEVLLLKYAQDATYAQLAQKLGVSQSAVEGRLHRARGRLRKALRRREPALAEA